MSADFVIGLVIVALCAVIIYQLWQTYDIGDMTLLIEHGQLYVDCLSFSLVGAPYGNRFESGKHPVEVRKHEGHDCLMCYAHGFGWIGGHPDCDAVLGSVRGRHAVVADTDVAERLRVRVQNALMDGKKVSLEVRNG